MSSIVHYDDCDIHISTIHHPSFATTVWSLGSSTSSDYFNSVHFYHSCISFLKLIEVSSLTAQTRGRRLGGFGGIPTKSCVLQKCERLKVALWPRKAVLCAPLSVPRDFILTLSSHHGCSEILHPFCPFCRPDRCPGPFSHPSDRLLMVG